MNYKYPYIPKEYYPAVMGACKWIRESGYFNKAVRYYADLYGVDEEELAKYIRERQGAGQKAANRKTARKYMYYLVVDVIDYESEDDCGTRNSWYWDTIDDALENTYLRVIKATDKDNAIKQVTGVRKKNWSPYGYIHRASVIGEYQNEQSALDAKGIVTREQVCSVIKNELFPEWKRKWES